MSKVYVVMPDTTAPFDQGKFHTYIQSMYTQGHISAWWHYLPGSMYFIASNLEVNQIYNLLIKHMPLRKHIIMEVNPKNQQGWMQKEAWNWFAPYRS